MKVMDVECCETIHFHLLVKVRQRIQSGFLGTPVETLLPMLHQALDVLKRRAIVPGSALELAYYQYTARTLVV